MGEKRAETRQMDRSDHRAMQVAQAVIQSRFMGTPSLRPPSQNFSPTSSRSDDKNYLRQSIVLTLKIVEKSFQKNFL